MGSTILSDLVQQFLSATGAWYGALLPIAQRLFLLLAAIHLSWSAAWWVIERDDLNPILVQLLRRLLSIGFFWAVLINANVWIPAIIDGFVSAGRTAASRAGSTITELNPSTVLDQGIAVAATIYDAIDTSGWLSALAGALLAVVVSILILLAFIIIAATLTIALVEMYVVIGGGVLLLGFAGSPWTLPFAERYLSLAVATGIKLFLLFLIIGMGTALAASWAGLMADAGTDVVALFQVLAGSVVYAFVAWNIPSYAAALLGGSLVTHAGTAMHTARVGASLLAFPAAAAVLAAGRGAHATAAMLEAGRLGAAHYASGGGVAGAGATAGAALGSAALATRARRLAGLGYGTTASEVRERRAARYPESFEPRENTPKRPIPGRGERS